MASVKFQPRGRSKGRIPLSLFAPLRVTDEKPLYKVLPNNAVPQGMGDKGQQIGYWVEQQRWRMRRGDRVDLPSNWHFYFLGTGPHSDLPFRKRTDGVFWVAIDGAKTQPTGLGVRKSSEKPLVPKFKNKLPNNVEIVEPTTPNNSRANSRSRSRGGQSNSRGNSQNRGDKSRNQSRNRSQSNDRGSDSRDDLVAAVKKALEDLGVGAAKPKGKTQSGKNTPKNKSRSGSVQRTEAKDKPEWRRTPSGDESVEVCFGPRGGTRNFGSTEFVAKGVNAPGYAQAASLVPGAAALLFGGNVATKEMADGVEITYTYKMLVPKDDKNLEIFLAQVDAYKLGDPKPQRKVKRSRTPTPKPATEPIYDDVAADPTYANLEWDTTVEDGVEMINEVFDTQN
uniref:Nucleoprotein n=1 Tax=Bat Coronavirus SkGX19 TaxID=3018915 RepID=A0AA49IEJ7_9NIDO|nr:nucleocapsid phosphoprotein [Bat Coronavirus SkGX19]